MGRTSRWFRSLLGFKKSSVSDSGKAKDKKSKSGGNNGSFSSESSTHPYVLDANKHAIAVAAATAAVAEAALAAAHAAAEVVRLTTGGSRATAAAAANYATSVNTDRRRHLAAVIIQSCFRAYLSRRALKALKGLVKLQALVRGHIVRKQSTHMLHRMQAMARIQAQACAHRAYLSEAPYSSSKSSHTQQPDLAYIKMFDHQYGAPGNRRRNGSPLKRSVSKSSTKENIDREKTYVDSTWLDKWMEENSANKHRSTLTTNGYGDGEMHDKILEVDTWKPHMNRDTSHHVSAWNHNEPIFIPFDALSTHSTKSQKPTRSPSPLEFSSFSSWKVNQAAGMAGNSPGACSASSRPGSCYKGGPSTPTRSECSQSFFSSYMGYPSYMAYTQSSQAKVRSRSAPRQRMDSEKPGSVKRFVRGYWDEETSSERGWPLHANFSTTAYPGTDSFDNFGVPDQGDAMRYGSAYCGR